MQDALFNTKSGDAQVLIRPRPYQVDCKDAVLQGIRNGLRRLLYSLPTSTGKTVTFAELIREFLGWEWKVLVLADQVELIDQAYNKVRECIFLKDWEIGTEINVWKGKEYNKIIVGSVQTCYRPNRLPAGWIPNAIITDEADSAAAETYQKIYDRFGVPETCVHVGLTATPLRTDKRSLYAIDEHDNPVMLKRSGGKETPAEPHESVFEKMVYNLPIVDAMEEGWIVPWRVKTVHTGTSLEGLKHRNGDYDKGELNKRVNNAERTTVAINGWKEEGWTRPTMVYTASVEHAHDSAALWSQVCRNCPHGSGDHKWGKCDKCDCSTWEGFTVAAIDGETDKMARHDSVHAFKNGDLQVICTFGLFLRGTDMPNLSCIVPLRPTESWRLGTQMRGRGGRVWPGILDDLHEATGEERREAIANSPKPDCLVLEMADIFGKSGTPFTTPQILGLPANIDPQNHTVLEMKHMLDEFEEVRERVIGECPTTYEELAVRLRDVNLMRHSGAKNEQHWKATDYGYKFVGVPPGYQCNLVKDREGVFQLQVSYMGQELVCKNGKPEEMKHYLEHAARHAKEAVEQHRASLPRVSRGTLDALSEKQVKVLRRNGMSNAEIDAMPLGYAKKKIAEYVTAYYERQKAQV